MWSEVSPAIPSRRSARDVTSVHLVSIYRKHMKNNGIASALLHCVRRGVSVAFRVSCPDPPVPLAVPVLKSRKTRPDAVSPGARIASISEAVTVKP